MGVTFSSAAMTLDIRALPMSAVVMATGGLMYLSHQAFSSSSSSSSSSAPFDAEAFKPIVFVTAGWACMYYAFLFDQSATAFVVVKEARRAARKAGRLLE